MYLVPLSRDSRDFSRLVDATFDRFFGADNAAAARTPALDVAESDAAYIVTLDMPGVAKEDVKITVEGRRVSIAAKAEKAEDKTEGDRIVYRERVARSYARSFTLPQEVEQGEAGAKLESGVLTLTLPKRNPRVAAQITVN